LLGYIRVCLLLHYRAGKTFDRFRISIAGWLTVRVDLSIRLLIIRPRPGVISACKRRAFILIGRHDFSDGICNAAGG
jgi:hypothetical protein